MALKATKNFVVLPEVHRALGVTQKTAWFLLHRIRLAMQEGTGMLEGKGKTVEADETWIGGKVRSMNNRQRRKKANKSGALTGPYAYDGKAIVLGMLERGGRVRPHHVKNVASDTLRPLVRAGVAKDSALHTDKGGGYVGVGEIPYEELGELTGSKFPRYYEHKVVDHAEEYVRGNVHTNGIENFWSLLKRTIRGTYVSVEPFHLFRYLDEQAFRFSERRATGGWRFMHAVRSIVGKRLTHQRLIGAEAVSPT